jgi:hypothetical protein
MPYFHGVKWQQPVRWTLIIALGLILLLAAAGAVLHIPAVQSRVAAAISRSAGEQFGLDVRLGRVQLAWWKAVLEVEDVEVRNQEGEVLLRLNEAEVRGVSWGSRLYFGRVQLTGGTVDAAGWLGWSAALPEGGGGAVWHIEHLELREIDATWRTDTLAANARFQQVSIQDFGGAGDSLYGRVEEASGSLGRMRIGAVHFPAAGDWTLRGAIQTGPEATRLTLDTLRIDAVALSGALRLEHGRADGSWALTSSGGLARWVRPWLPGAPAGAALDEPFTLHAKASSTAEGWEVRDIDCRVAGNLVELIGGRVRGVEGDLTDVEGALHVEPFPLSVWLAERGVPLPEAAAPWLRTAARRSSGWTLSGAWRPTRYAIELAPDSWNGGTPPHISWDFDGTESTWMCEHLPVADALAGAPVELLTASGTLAGDLLDLIEADSLQGTLALEGRWGGGAALGPFATTYALDLRDGVRAAGELTSSDARATGNADWRFHVQPDGTWTAGVEGSVEGLQLPNKAWKAFGTFQADVAAAGDEVYNGGIALRTITLLERGAPVRFDRFDVHGKLTPSEIELEWMSDLTSGNVRASADLAAWERWWEAFSARAPLPVPSPELGTRFTVANAAPLAVLFDVPAVIAPGTVGRARVNATGIEVALTSDRIGWDGWSATGVDLRVAGDARAVEGTCKAAAVSDGNTSWARELDLDLEADSTWRLRGAARDAAGEPGHIAVELATDAEGNRIVRVPEAEVPVFGMAVALEGTGAEVAFAKDAFAFKGWQLAGPGFSLLLEGTVGPDPEDALVGELNLTQWPELEAWGVPAGRLAGASIRWEACGFGEDFEWTAQLRARDVAFREFQLDSMVAAATGGLTSGYVWTEAFRTGGGRLGASGKVPFDLTEELDFNVLMDRIPLDWTSVFLPPEAVTLSGDVSGQTQLAGTWDRLRLAGSLEGSALNVFIPSLGTSYLLDGRVDIEPGMFALDNWRVRDDRGREGRLTATVLHTDFGAWNFDANLTAPAPFHLMELTRDDNGLFYGSAFATGDVNVSGNSDDIAIEARLRTEEGTTFALPLDAASDVTYGGGFLSFRSPDAAAAPRARDFVKIKLNLGIEVTEAARARIIFDEAVGDEIVGKTRGNLALNIDDFERFTMNGDLEVLEGSYLFTLENVISKRFTVVPGGRLRWFGDPYAADIDLVASYRVRTRLNELLPSETDLPGRTPVDLRLGLQGNLLTPGIDFNVVVPDAEPRIQALVESALSNEDELNRQAVSLLVLGQFFNPDPASGAVGPAGLQNSGTGLLASQLGTWISSLTGGVDVGLDYGSDPLSGQQALAVALSTRLLDDRLQLEGAFGTNRLANTPSQDLQIQDIRVSYDLSESGRLQVTGYTQTTPTIPGQDGRISQGVGIRMRRDFHHLGELWEPRNRRRPAASGGTE